MLDFKENTKTLTLGVEMEIQVLDNTTLQLTPKAPEILERCANKRIIKEMFQSTLEIVTGVCEDAHQAGAELSDSLEEVKNAAVPFQVCFAGTATHPMADYNDRIVTATPRYHQLLDRNQWLIRRMAVYGLHVHLGMANGDECMRYNNFFLQQVPLLISLSASSPYWNGRDTGLVASRPTAYEAHPTSGIPYLTDSWKGFNRLYNSLLKTGSIESMKDIWWDFRPSPGYGTLELRICDGPATMLELQSITAFIHALAFWYRDHQEEFLARHTPVPEQWILRENKWRAIRYGLDAQIIEHDTLEIFSLREKIICWIDTLRSYFEKLDYGVFRNCLMDICSRGNSSHRQRAIMNRHNSLFEVVKFNAREFEARKPLWDNIPERISV